MGEQNSGNVSYNGHWIRFNPASAPEDGATITVKYKHFGLSASEIESFKSYMKERMHVTTQLIYDRTTEVGIDIDISVKHHRGFNGSEIATKVEEKLRALLAPRIGLLGRDFELSDITQAALSVEGVDYVTITSPTAKASVSIVQAATLSSLSVSHTQTDR